MHMSCAWLSGYRIQRVETPIRNILDADPNLYIPVQYRWFLHISCLLQSYIFYACSRCFQSYIAFFILCDICCFMFFSLLYRLAVYCGAHSGSKTLQMRERADCTTVDDMVNKESWRESNAYHKEKPTTKDTEKKNVTKAGHLRADSDSNSDSNSGSRCIEIRHTLIWNHNILNQITLTVKCRDVCKVDICVTSSIVRY